jgi:hypothetical protein
LTRVLVRPTSDKDVREYHIIGERISDLPYARFFRPTWGTEKEFASLGSGGEGLAAQLMSPDNGNTIEMITFRPESVRVQKAPTADWGSLEPKTVIPALQEALKSEIEVRQYGHNELRQLAHV